VDEDIAADATQEDALGALVEEGDEAEGEGIAAGEEVAEGVGLEDGETAVV
jgi:hypothetical protein